jgi:hypothetical protein
MASASHLICAQIEKQVIYICEAVEHALGRLLSLRAAQNLLAAFINFTIRAARFN